MFNNLKKLAVNGKLNKEYYLEKWKCNIDDRNMIL